MGPLSNGSYRVGVQGIHFRCHRAGWLPFTTGRRRNFSAAGLPQVGKRVFKSSIETFEGGGACFVFDVKNAYHCAKKLVASGQCREAQQIAEQAINQYGDHVQLWEIAGIACFEHGDVEGAIVRLEKATVLAPLSLPGRLVLAWCYIQGGMLEAAEAILEYMAELYFAGQFDVAYESAFVAALSQIKRFDLAASVCRRSFMSDPTNGHACYGIGWYQMLIGDDLRDVLCWYVKAVQLQPENARYRLTLGLAYVEMLDVQSAVKVFRGFNKKLISGIKCRCCLVGMIEYLSRYDNASTEIVAEMKKQLISVQYDGYQDV